MRDDQATRDGLTVAAAFEVDPDRSSIIIAVGQKGSGKSEVCRTIFNAWPYDKVVIDVTGDARPAAADTLTITAPVPGALPAPIEPARYVTAWVRLDPRRKTYVEDQDDALGLGLYPRHRNTCIWVDEFSQMATPTKMGPNLRLALQSSRHYFCTLLLAFPRPRFVPLIIWNQVDLLFVFRVPNKKDRETISSNIGVEPPLFEAKYAETMARDPHAFLLWDARQHKLIGCPPLPLASTHGPRA